MAEAKKAVKKETPNKEARKEESIRKIAVIRITGDVRIKDVVRSTLVMLNLPKKNSCVVIPATPSMLGMVEKIRDFVTYGDIDDETFKMLKEKRDIGKKYFPLAPPRKGYGRKGTKLPFRLGGALGNRKEKINDLIRRMI